MQVKIVSATVKIIGFLFKQVKFTRKTDRISTAARLG